MVCDQQGLIGREMFAIDGVKLAAVASKARSGQRKDVQREAGKIGRTVEKLLTAHQSRDGGKTDVEDSAQPRGHVPARTDSVGRDEHGDVEGLSWRIGAAARSVTIGVFRHGGGLLRQCR